MDLSWDEESSQRNRIQKLKENWPKYLFYIVVAAVILVGIYIEFRYCGGFTGTMSDAPRWCWWLR